MNYRLDFVTVEDPLFLHHRLAGHGLSRDLSYLGRGALSLSLISALLVLGVKPRVRPVWLGVGLAGEREGAVLLLVVGLVERLVVRLVERLVERLVVRLVVRGRESLVESLTSDWERL